MDAEDSRWEVTAKSVLVDEAENTSRQNLEKNESKNGTACPDSLKKETGRAADLTPELDRISIPHFLNGVSFTC